MKTLFLPRFRLSSCHISRVVSCLLLGVCVWITYQLFSSPKETLRLSGLNSKPHTSKFVVDTPGCSIPDIDPFDESLKEYVSPDPPIKCEAKPALTYTDGQALRINHTALVKFYKDELERCQFEKITRLQAPNADDIFQYSSPVEFNIDVEDTRAEFLRVACFGKKGGLIYANFHAVVFPKKKVELVCNAKHKTFTTRHKTEEIFDFLILGVDSVSRLNFLRQMPKTHEFLVNTLGAVGLEGYNKVADNTFVNLSPMFAGKFTDELPWGDSFREVHFDNYSFIWKEAASFGYRTLFAEDAPHISIFNYDKPGFSKPPGDYYLRPFSLAVEDHGSIWNANHNCIGPKPETQVVLDYIHDFMKVFQGKPRFAFSFITRLTHDGVNKAGAADDLYLNFFKQMYTEGLLKNTVVLFYSDHGMRFGPIRETYIGRLEERLPFLYLSLPSHLRKQYPAYMQSLRKNVNRLTTPFDIHTTLTSLLHFHHDIKTNDPLKRGLNLLAEVPATRTCTDAAVHSHWCTCHRHETVNTDSDIAQLSALTVVEHINELVGSHGLMCATLVLDEVLTASQVIASDRMVDRSHNIHDVLRDISLAFPDEPSSTEYIVTFRTQPGEALFEANVRKSVSERTLKVVGEISRINAYGDQSACIQYFEHKKFCYCNE